MPADDNKHRGQIRVRIRELLERWKEKAGHAETLKLIQELESLLDGKESPPQRGHVR